MVWTFVMLAVLMLAFVSYIGIFRMKMKQLMIQNYGNSINAFVQQLDDKVIRAVDNSKDLALLGSLYYKTDRSIPLTNKSIIMLFRFKNDFNTKRIFTHKRRFFKPISGRLA